jgi:AraC-like DNA-binding protein
MQIFKEITPLKPEDTIVVIDSVRNGFDYPIHNHPEYEINLILGMSGTRIVGDSTERYKDIDLVLLGPFLYHKWDGDKALQDSGEPYRVITIQFAIDLFSGQMFKKEKFHKIKELLSEAARGIHFYGKTLDKVTEIMTSLTDESGFGGILQFFKLLDILSNSKECECLASLGFSPIAPQANSNRIQTTYSYIIKNYTNAGLRITDIASYINMSDSAFSHFFQKYAFRSFTQFLIDLRIGHACKMLLDTDLTIAQISDASGFNNLANFNRLFKKYRKCSPFEYKKMYVEKNTFDWANQRSPWQFVPSDAKLNSVIMPMLNSTKLIHY